jgi:hypothetical protein
MFLMRVRVWVTDQKRPLYQPKKHKDNQKEIARIVVVVVVVVIDYGWMDEGIDRLLDCFVAQELDVSKGVVTIYLIHSHSVVVIVVVVAGC